MKVNAVEVKSNEIKQSQISLSKTKGADFHYQFQILNSPPSPLALPTAASGPSGLNMQLIETTPHTLIHAQLTHHAT